MTERERRADVPARLLATLSFLFGLGGLGGAGYVLLRQYQQETKVAPIDPEVARQLRENLIGDCVNENVLRQALGVPVVDVETCEAERQQWREELDKEKLDKGNNGF